MGVARVNEFSLSDLLIAFVLGIVFVVACCSWCFGMLRWMIGDTDDDAGS
jgi:hypothetical protein